MFCLNFYNSLINTDINKTNQQPDKNEYLLFKKQTTKTLFDYTLSFFCCDFRNQFVCVPG